MRHLIFVIIVALAGCPQPANPPPAPELPDASSGASCSTACENMRLLGCEVGKPSPKGASCETVCDNVHVNNAGAGFPVGCLTRARSCKAADACR